ncbi:hypothetical protein ACFP3U_11820 [Kitasatospora misakiensis]|uniref:Extensin n=1 Tax=Kitasatospora misakiensis TaxID=67330 RepID=A0ABW0X1L7_9ACTN
MSTNRSRRIDRDTAEQLLAGAVGGPSAGQDASLTGPDGSTGRTGVARVLAAAAAPATRDDLAGEEAALAAFREARLAPVPAVAAAPAPVRRRSMATATLTRAFSTKAAAVVLGATALGGVAVAAGTGNLPSALGGGSDEPHRGALAPVASAPPSTPAQRSGGRTAAPFTTGGPSGSASGAPSGGSAGADPTTVDPSASPARPRETPSRTPGEGKGSANPGAHAALCKAFTDKAGKGDRTRPPATDPQFGALITEAGGPDKVEEYCARILRGAGDDDHQGGPGSGPARPGGGSGSGGSSPGGNNQGGNNQSGSSQGSVGPGPGTGGDGDGGSGRASKAATAPPTPLTPPAPATSGRPKTDRTDRPDDTSAEQR